MTPRAKLAMDAPGLVGGLKKNCKKKKQAAVMTPRAKLAMDATGLVGGLVRVVSQSQQVFF